MERVMGVESGSQHTDLSTKSPAMRTEMDSIVDLKSRSGQRDRPVCSTNSHTELTQPLLRLPSMRIGEPCRMLLFPLPRRHSMTINIDRMSAEELGQLIRAAEQHRDKLVQEKLLSVRQKCMDLALADGLSITELVPDLPLVKGRTGASKRAAAGPKYRNPLDPSQTWGGRGKRPDWFKNALAAGKSEVELKV